MKKLMRYLLLLPLWLLLFACEKVEESMPDGQGVLRVGVALQGFSRAETPGDGSIYDGGGMEDLTLVVVDPNSKVAAKQQLTALTGEDRLVKEVVFEHLNIGNHTLYAYANTERSFLSEAKTLLASLEVGDSFGAAERDALFTTRTGTSAPQTNQTQPLLLTASKEVAIEMGTTSTSITLLRPVARFEVLLNNHATVPMTVTGLTMSPFNPSTGYLLPHGGVLPASLTYNNLPSYDSYTGGTDLIVAAGAEQTIYRTELFENRAPSYTLDLGLAITARVNSVVTTNQTNIATNTAYLIHNVGTGSYLIDNNGRLAVVGSLNDLSSIEQAQWRFSGKSSGYLTNVATGNSFYRSTEASNSGSDLTFGKNGNYYNISYRSVRTYYYLRDNKGSVGYANVDDDTRDWQLQTYSTSTAVETIPHSAEDLQLYVVDPQTAAVTPMREQLRNQHIKVSINAYYSEQLGSFRFEVTPWAEKNEEVEFN